MKNSLRLKRVFLVTLGAMLWGASGTTAQYLFQTENFTPEWLVVIRMIISGILLLIMGLIRKDKNVFGIWKKKDNAVRLILFGLLGMIGAQYTYFAAINHGNAATATILQYLSPILITFYICMVNKKFPALKQIVCIAMAVIGTFLIITKGNMNSLSISKAALFWGIASAFACALYTLQPIRLIKEYGSICTVGWKCIDGLWYYFDSNGYMKTLSWIETNGKWYFVSDTGCMLRSTTVDGYTLGADGAWIKDASDNSNKAGWKQDNSGWWYLNENGSYATYWKSFDTDKIEHDYDGRYVEVKTWYYFGADGYMKTGWQMIDGNWYYFKASGEMATDENVDGYILGKDGAMINDLFVKKSDGDFQIKILDKEHILSDKKLTFCIINNSGKPVTEYWGPTSAGPYWIERYIDGKWTGVHFISPYDDCEEVPQYINETDIKTVNVQTVDLSKYKDFSILEYGKYRVCYKAGEQGNVKYETAYAEFEVNPDTNNSKK